VRIRIKVPRAIAVIAATIALGVAAGGVADASPAGQAKPAGVTGYQIVHSGYYSVDPNTAAETTVTCPAGMVPISGGESNNGGGVVHLVSSSPYESNWSTAVFNTGSTWASYSTYAVCVSGLSSYQVMWANPLTIGANGIPTESDAYCPAGMAILGGGFSTGGPYNMQLYSSYPTNPTAGQQSSWSTTLANRNGTDVLAESIVVCGTGLNLQRQTGEVWISGQFTNQTVTCPAGTSVISGGVFSIAESGTGFVWQGVITDSYPTSNTSWTALDFPTYEGGEPTIAFDMTNICAS
jgi:hypothetical protein